ncbi:hypothetical protein ABTE32_21935, partial [Acinetobacter baumannii]
QNGRPVTLLDKHTILERYNGVNGNGLLGGLYSDTETIVDPRVAIPTVAKYLEEYLDVQFIWGKAVTNITSGKVWMGSETLEADI